MATVRFSATLVDQILKNAAEVHAPAIKLAKQAPTNWGDRFYNLLMRDYIPVVSQLPDKFFKQVSTIEFRPPTTMSFSAYGCGSVILSQPKSMPHDTDALKHLPVHMTVWSTEATAVLRPDPYWEGLDDEIVRYYENVVAHVEKSNQFVASVKRVLQAHSTLAPALKTWPPLWELVPDDAKRKHEEKTQRGKRGEINPDELGIDLSQMTAAVALKRITG